MDFSAIALRGLEQACAQFDQAADRIAGTSQRAAGDAPADIGTLSQEIVSLVSAKLMIELNAATVRVNQEVSKAVLDVTA